MKRFKAILREISNYFYLRKVVAKEARNRAEDSRWRMFKLKKNWACIIYTTVSLREEEMGEEELVRNWMAMERMRPINEYLSELGLQEIVFPSIEYIPNSRSYAVVYVPFFQRAHSFMGTLETVFLGVGYWTNCCIIVWERKNMFYRE